MSGGWSRVRERAPLRSCCRRRNSKGVLPTRHRHTSAFPPTRSPSRTARRKCSRATAGSDPGVRCGTPHKNALRMIRLSAPIFSASTKPSSVRRCASSTSPVIQFAMPSRACHSATAKASLSAIARVSASCAVIVIVSLWPAIMLESNNASQGPVRSQSSWRRAATHARRARSTASSPANRSAASSASSDNSAALTGWSGSPKIGATSLARVAIDAPSRVSQSAPIGADANSVFAASKSPIETANCSAIRMLSSSRSICANPAASSELRSCSPASRANALHHSRCARLVSTGSSINSRRSAAYSRIVSSIRYRVIVASASALSIERRTRPST